MFTVYSKPGCSHCKKVKRLLDLAEVRHVVYDMGRDFSPKEFTNKFGDSATFPQVVFDDINIGGCTSTLTYLRENEYL